MEIQKSKGALNFIKSIMNLKIQHYWDCNFHMAIAIQDCPKRVNWTCKVN